MLRLTDWVHLALQVRADGATSIFLNRELVHEAAERMDVDGGRLWRIDVSGASVDTELRIRNLSLWRGERYGGGSGG